jgi:tetratricopeptide (TPR) repeat protein
MRFNCGGRASGSASAAPEVETPLPERKLKVFLSSTAKDLTAFRKTVHARLAASPLFDCIRQEDFGARPHPAVALCQAQVLECDLFVGLIGMRRGWEPPDDNPKHRSITEMEYDWAKDIAPRFMYVTPDEFPVPGNLRETDDEHRRQLSFRTRVLSDLVVSRDGFASIEALAILIVDRLTDHVLKQPRPHTDDPLKGLPDAVAERIVRLLDERGDLKKAERGGLERDIVLRLAKRLKPDDALDFDRAVTELENGIAIALDAIAKGERGTNQGKFINDVLARVGEQTKAGQFDEAAKEVDAALVALEQHEAEQQEEMRRARLTLLQAGIAQDILRRDAASAARRAEQAVAIEYPDDAARFAALRDKWDKFYIEGRDKGLNLSLEVAIEIARAELGLADTVDRRGVALNDLGIALEELGARESGKERLDEAVAAYREALKEQKRESAPLDWAITQNNLGNALTTFGERESGTARLDEAVAAYREALKERTRERVPLQWATTQNNLGTALQTLGARESGTARLDEAVAAFREALKEYTRERMPLDWAMTQNNLGIALRNLGARESDTARLEEAVAAYREALKEYTRERVPLDWAMTQNNLAIALRNLGERETGTARLDEAVESYREALKEYTRERVPLQWATTQTNLGTALETLGARETGTARLEEAVEAFRAALKERTRERVPLQWAITTGHQGVAFMRLADRRNDAGVAATAVSRIEQALAVSREGGHESSAQYFEAQLPEARAIRDRLDKA